MTSPAPGSRTAAPAPAPSTAATAPKPLTKALEDAMFAKATAPLGKMFLASLSGGAFIALGFVFMVT